jgi:ABC-2 type transport system ATP-binding protein
MADVIEVEHLCKDYRRRRGTARAVDGLDLAVPAGGVYGFLGPNGSGKTTTIRCLLGLSRATAGSCALLGARGPRELPAVIGRVGALVELPGVNPGLSARRTLTLLGTAVGIGASRVQLVLDQVGLGGREDELVKGYSLGMRQRLGLAVALLKDPELLILDEPANGLDPAGMREMRGLVRALGAEGRTVFLSSHLLGEVEQVCERVAIVARGRTVASGAIADVLAAAAPRALHVGLGDLAGGEQTLAAAGFRVTRVDEHLEVVAEPHHGEDVSRALAAAGLFPRELRPVESTLEDAFLALTGEVAP